MNSNYAKLRVIEIRRLILDAAEIITQSSVYFQIAAENTEDDLTKAYHLKAKASAEDWITRADEIVRHLYLEEDKEP